MMKKITRCPETPESPVSEIALEPILASDGRIPKSAQPRYTEPIFMHFYVMAQERGGFETEEELQAFIEQYMPVGEQPRFPPPSKPWHQAQDLAYRGWGERTAGKRRAIARKALKISPDAPDAYLLLAHDAPTWEEAEALCAQAMAAGERLMGPNYREEFEGGFWDVAITRPYMRARFALGYCLWKQGRMEEAASHFRALLLLNPNDNQGARYVLLAIWLESQKDREARGLISQYVFDESCFWAYNRALLAFRQFGNSPRARRALERALLTNWFVLLYLLGLQRPPRRKDPYIMRGSPTEAVEFLSLYEKAWQSTPGALDWLRSQFRPPETGVEGK